MSLSTSTAQRRLATIPALLLTAALFTVTLPIWLPLAVLADALRRRFRFPLARLLAFGLCWSWLETAGVVAAFGLWLIGQGRNRRAHYRLQGWWATNMLRALGPTCGIRVSAENVEAFQPGPVLLFVRHASLADSLVSAYVVAHLAHMQPRYVLKRELLMDPCLDVVGQRIPNYFLDRGANDSGPELAAITDLTKDLGASDVGIIFPEGTRSNSAKRAKALSSLRERDPARVAVAEQLNHLLPPRPSGALAMRLGAPTCDVVFAWHTGFEGLDTFGGILHAIQRGVRPIRFVARRVTNAEIPAGSTAFGTWLDQQWLQMDSEVGSALATESARIG
jgi:1-acyl-sn-glycerol-3-phosphate acyltransferase